MALHMVVTLSSFQFLGSAAAEWVSVHFSTGHHLVYRAVTLIRWALC